MCMHHTQCAASPGPDRAVCDPKEQLSLLLSPLQTPAPSIPDLCHSSTETTSLATLSGESWGRGPQIPEWKIMAAVAVVQWSPFNLTALATMKTPQGQRWEHTNASGLLIPGAVP